MTPRLPRGCLQFKILKYHIFVYTKTLLADVSMVEQNVHSID